MNRQEWAEKRRSLRLLEKLLQFGPTLSIPSWVPKEITDLILLSCSACQDYMDIRYGSAECIVCPLANFVDRLVLRSFS
jgi:hypothetical protein